MGRLLNVFVPVSVAGLATCWYLTPNPKGYITQLQGSVAALGPWQLPVWMLIHAAAIVGCFPGAIAFEAGAGYLFGMRRGVAAVLVAKTCGACVCFWLGRTLLRERAQGLLERYPKFKLIAQGAARDGWWFVLLARLSPVPSYLVNYGLATIDLRFVQDYLLGTLAGMLLFAVQNTYSGYLAKQGVANLSDGFFSEDSKSGWDTASQLLPMLLPLGTVMFISSRLRLYLRQYQADLGEADGTVDVDGNPSKSQEGQGGQELEKPAGAPPSKKVADLPAGMPAASGKDPTGSAHAAQRVAKNRRHQAESATEQKARTL